MTTALRLFVTDGFHGTPTSKIAFEAKVANGTLFYHYKTKEDLVIAIYNSVKEEQAKTHFAITKKDGFIAAKFRDVFFSSVYWALKNRDKFNYIHQFHFSPHMAKMESETLKHQARAHHELITEGINRKLLKQQPIELVTALFNGQVYGVYQYLTSTVLGEEEQERVINVAYELVWDMLKYM